MECGADFLEHLNSKPCLVEGYAKNEPIIIRMIIRMIP